MELLSTRIPDVVILEPKIFTDDRGYFFESFNAERFEKDTGVDAIFVQDNCSGSKRNVLRGLHYQISRPQGKLVRVMVGEIFDVAVDLRKSSPTFGQWVGVTLSQENHRQVWIPPGFAHGFLVLSEQADVLYKTTDYWAPQWERTIAWDDPTLGIDWPTVEKPILSQKDQCGCPFGIAQMD